MRLKEMILTADLLREVVYYDPATGVFTWRNRRRQMPAGSLAGTPNPDGYWYIKIDGKRYPAHRLAWLYVYGEWPSGFLDHKDCNKENSCIENLRLASKSQNGANRRQCSHNTSGYKGVSWHRQNNKWSAGTRVNGIRHHLGYFDTPEAAHAAYVDAAKRLHGEFARAE